MAPVSCRRADCCFFFAKLEGNEPCFRTSELMLNVNGVLVKMCTYTHEALYRSYPKLQQRTKGTTNGLWLWIRKSLEKEKWARQQYASGVTWSRTPARLFQISCT